MGKWTYKVEVSDYRPWFWARWKFQFTAEKAAREEDQHYGGKTSGGISNRWRRRIVHWLVLVVVMWIFSDKSVRVMCYL